MGWLARLRDFFRRLEGFGLDDPPAPAPRPATPAPGGQPPPDPLAPLNAARTCRGLRPLAHDFGLETFAQDWAGTMARRNQMSHGLRVTGDDFETRFRRSWPERRGGECVGYGYAAAAAAAAAWLDDPPHRAVVLDPAYTHCGVASAAAPGGVRYWAATFAE